jgi:hypothetical protein
MLNVLLLFMVAAHVSFFHASNQCSICINFQGRIIV